MPRLPPTVGASLRLDRAFIRNSAVSAFPQFAQFLHARRYRFLRVRLPLWSRFATVCACSVRLRSRDAASVERIGHGPRATLRRPSVSGRIGSTLAA
jgi:hypothetical protein